MKVKPMLKRFFEAIILSAIAGGIAYGLTAWLAPPSVSAYLVAGMVAAITAMGNLSADAMLNAFGRNKGSPWSPPETYYDFDFSLEKYRRGQED